LTNAPTLLKTLPNGLTLLLREARNAPVAELQFWIRVGAADERPGEEGLAHFHEHMLFKGTQRRGVGEIAGEIESVGGQINAFTSFDVTVYHVTLPSDALPTGLDVLADAFRFSSFDPTEIEREVEVVLEEIRRAQDTPEDVLGDALFSTVYSNHPYGRPILGPPENVATFDRKKLVAFFSRWYRPYNLTIVGVGDFDARQFARRIERTFAGGTLKGPKKPNKRAKEATQKALRSKLLTRPFERAHLEIAFPCVGFDHPDAPLLDLLAYILGEGDSSRLVRELKERDGLVDQIHASCYTPRDPGIFGISAVLDPAHCEDTIRAMASHAQRLGRERVRDEELERARINFLSSLYFELESVSGTAGKLGNFQVLCGDYRAEARYLNAIRTANPNALREAARRYLRPERMNVVAVLPETSGQLDHESVIALVEKVQHERPLVQALPKRKAHATAASKIVSHTLSNGAQLHVWPRHDIPVVAVRAAFKGGLLAETDASTQAGMSLFLSRMWTRGTVEHDAAAFARKVEGLAAEIEGFSGLSSTGLALDVPTASFAPALDLFAQALCSPTFSTEEIKRERREILGALVQRKDNLAALTFDLFRQELFREHPYGRPLLGTREVIRTLSTRALAGHHARIVTARNTVIAVAGDIDPEFVAEELSARLAALPSHEPAALSPAPTNFAHETKRVTRRKHREQAHLVIGFPGVCVNDPDRFALEVLCQLLAGQGGRLFVELRDKHSLAYALNAVNVEGLSPGYFAVYIATAPQKLTRAEHGIFTELTRILENPIPLPELERAKRCLIGGFAISQQRSATRAGQMALDALYGLSVEESLRYPEQIRSIGAEELKRVATRIFRMKAATIASIRP